MNPLEIIWKNIQKPDSIYWFESASLENVKTISTYYRTLNNTWLFMEAKLVVMVGVVKPNLVGTVTVEVY